MRQRLIAACAMWCCLGRDPTRSLGELINLCNADVFVPGTDKRVAKYNALGLSDCNCRVRSISSKTVRPSALGPYAAESRCPWPIWDCVLS